MKRSTFLSLIAALPLALFVACDSTPTAVEQTDNSSNTTNAKPGSGSTAPNPAIAFTDYYYTNTKKTQSTIDLLVMDANGGNVTSIYSAPSGKDIRHPAWSPDGSKIAFQQGWSDPTFGNWYEIMVIDVGLATDSRGNTVVRGSNARRLTFGGQLRRHYQRPTWGENSGVIYFTTDYITGTGTGEQVTAEILSVPVTGGAVTTLYTSTNSRSDYFTFNTLDYNLSTNEFVVSKARAYSSFTNGQWVVTSSTSTMDVVMYNTTLGLWQFDPNRSWGPAGSAVWSHSGANLIFKWTTSIGVTTNAAGSTPTYFTSSLVRPAASPVETKIAALDWGGRKIYAVDFSSGTPVQTLLHTLPAGSSESTMLSWKRGQ